MSNSDYKLVSKNDDIVMKKKDNKYKLEFESKIKTYDKLMEIIKKQKFYELLYLLNKDIIESYEGTLKSDKNFDTLLTFSIIEDDEYDEFDKYYIRMNNNMEIEEHSKKIIVTIKGTGMEYKTKDYVKINVDDLKTKISIDKEKMEIDIKLTFKFADKKMPTHIEKSVSLFFNKVIHRFKKYITE